MISANYSHLPVCGNHASHAINTITCDVAPPACVYIKNVFTRNMPLNTTLSLKVITGRTTNPTSVCALLAIMRLGNGCLAEDGCNVKYWIEDKKIIEYTLSKHDWEPLQQWAASVRLKSTNMDNC